MSLRGVLIQTSVLPSQFLSLPARRQAIIVMPINQSSGSRESRHWNCLLYAMAIGSAAAARAASGSMGAGKYSKVGAVCSTILVLFGGAFCIIHGGVRLSALANRDAVVDFMRTECKIVSAANRSKENVDVAPVIMKGVSRDPHLHLLPGKLDLLVEPGVLAQLLVSTLLADSSVRSSVARCRVLILPSW